MIQVIQVGEILLSNTCILFGIRKLSYEQKRFIVVAYMFFKRGVKQILILFQKSHSQHYTKLYVVFFWQDETCFFYFFRLSQITFNIFIIVHVGQNWYSLSLAPHFLIVPCTDADLILAFYTSLYTTAQSLDRM